MLQPYSKNEGVRSQLGRTPLTILIGSANLFVCMSLDVYLPAVPQMATNLDTTAELVNFTMLAFYLFLAVGTLLSGPISDKYGRKIPLTICISLYILASIGCSASQNITALIFMRACEALGGGGMISISTALVKDCFSSSEDQTKVMSVAQAVSMIGPMFAPIIGSLLLMLFNWRAIFVFLSIFGVICLVLALFLAEPLAPDERLKDSFTKSFTRLIEVARHPNFTLPLLCVAFLLIPFMGYVVVSSYIYMEHFQLSTFAYGVFYSVNTLFSVVAPLIYAKNAGKVKPKSVLILIASLMFISGILTISFGFLSPLAFLACIIPMTIGECLLRPCAVPLLLEQQEKDTGSASALISFADTFIGSAGMLIGTLRFMEYIQSLAVLLIVCSLVATVTYIGIVKAGIRIKGLSRY